MPQDFKPIFDYLDEMKAELKADIARVEAKTDTLVSAVDNLTKMVKGFLEEMIVNRKRIERIEDWIRQASAKLGIPIQF